MLSAARAFISVHLHAPLLGVVRPPRCLEALRIHPLGSQGQLCRMLHLDF
jgi:hypothetical protein